MAVVTSVYFQGLWSVPVVLVFIPLSSGFFVTMVL